MPAGKSILQARAMHTESWWIWLGVGATFIGAAVFNIGTWLFHAYLDRECTATASEETLDPIKQTVVIFVDMFYAHSSHECIATAVEETLDRVNFLIFHLLRFSAYPDRECSAVYINSRNTDAYISSSAALNGE